MDKTLIGYQWGPMFAVNDVLAAGDAKYRVIDINCQQVFLFELEANKGYPMPSEYSELKYRYEIGDIRILDNHDYAAPSIHYSKREQLYEETKSRFDVIKPIIETQGYLISSVRGVLVNSQIELTGYSKAQIYRLLRLYWAHGQCLEALATRYDNCGAKGKIRKFQSKKPGKRRNDGKKHNAIRTCQHVALMHQVIRVHHFGKKQKLTYAYRRFVTLCKSQFANISNDDIPSINSLRNVLKKHYSLEKYARGLYDPRVYKKDIRSLTGTATAAVSGPGDRYEIDATLFEVHVVSERDRGKVIGKPVVYLVVDVFSRLITGFYVGFYSPSYRIATIALLSSVQDKSHLLSKYNISPDICSQWPASGLPSALLSDKAELFGLNGSHLVETTGIRIENTASGRSDAKGIVEKHLGLMQEPFYGDRSGKSNKVTNKKAGAIDGRLTASLTMQEFEEIVVSEIVLINNCRVMFDYDCEKDMPDDMPRIPINIWNWGIVNRTGALRQVDEENLRVAVLPKDEATVSRKGVRFKDLFFTSEALEKLGWFIRIKNNPIRPQKVKVLYDPMSVNQIYVILPEGCSKPILCLLKTESRAFINCSFEEVKVRRAEQTQLAYATDQYDELKRLNEEKTQSIFKHADKEKKRLVNKKSDAQVKRDIPKNRKQAREEERSKLIDEFSPPQMEQIESENNGLSKIQDEFSNPDLDQLFNLTAGKDFKDETNRIDDEY
jgi:putative transposase